jgi:hypothetical protein
MILEERMADCSPKGALYADRLSIESIVSRGLVSHLGVTGLFSMGRHSGGFFPADVPSDDIPDLFKLATTSIQALGCDFGCYRTEIKVTSEGHKIIEVNGRPTGLAPATVKLASGLSLLPLSMGLALCEHVVVDGPLACDRLGYRYYCEPPIGQCERPLLWKGRRPVS